MPKTPTPTIKLLPGEYPQGEGDFCVSIGQDDRRFAEICNYLESDKNPNRPYVEEELEVVFPGTCKGKKVRAAARAMLTYSQRRSKIAASLRLLNKAKTPISNGIDRNFLASFDNVITAQKDNEFLFWADAIGDFILSSVGIINESKGVSPLNFAECGSDLLNHDPQGLIVISGGTGTGKSVVANGCIMRYLLRYSAAQFLENKSPPHLVTFEDPIESNWPFWQGTDQYSLGRPKSVDAGLDDQRRLIQQKIETGGVIAYTAREKLKDVENISIACRHALRQKPTLFFIGEVRDPEEWHEVLHLAGTGHLVVTTCHASSLVETFAKLSVKSTGTAEGRHALASSLLSVIHVRNQVFAWNSLVTKISNGRPADLPKKRQGLLSVWKRTQESVSNFVADGLSSIFPDGSNILGYSQSTDKLLKLQSNSHHQLISLESNRKKVVQQANIADVGF